MQKLMLLAAFTLLTAFTPTSAADGECPDREPQVSTTTIWGQSASCTHVTCPQNHSIDYEYKCTTYSPGNYCAAGAVLGTHIKKWSCTGSVCSEHEDRIMVMGIVKKACPNSGGNGNGGH